VSIRRIKRGGRSRWVVRYYEAGKSGPQRQRTFDQKADAEFFDVSIRRGRQLGQLSAEVLGSEQTVEEFIGEWWEKYALPTLKPGTLESYAYVLDRWIVPLLGPLRLRDVSRETIDNFKMQLVRHGAGAPTQTRCLGIVQGIFRRAVEWRRMSGNPVAGVPRPRHVRSSSIDAREPETVEAIRAKLLAGFSWQTIGKRGRVVEHYFAPSRAAAALVSILAYEGPRPAEAFALEWRDVLTLAGKPRERIQIRRSYSAEQLDTPKSGRAREIELFGPVAQELAELFLAEGRPPLQSLVFHGSKGGHLRRQNFRRRVWLPALTAAGIPGFRPYDLRHTCATLMIYEGRTINEVAEHLGHADPGFTARTYAHVFRDARDRRGLSIEDAIREARALERTAREA
jgi:integrase